MLANVYLIGEIYYIQPIHTGRSYLFLKKPENNITGKNNNGIIPEATLASVNIDPNINPNELPQKLQSININKKVKTIPAFISFNYIIQYIISPNIVGGNTIIGRSIIDLLKKYERVEYNFVFYYFINTSLYVGKLITTGDIDVIRVVMETKNNAPLRL